MTSSDLTRLPEGAKARVAARVGSSIDGTSGAGGASVDGAGVRLAFGCAEFNGGITDRLLTGALDAITSVGGDLGSVTVAWAPGAFELPLIARRFAGSGQVDAVICLGAVIRGDTGHYDFVAGECASGLQRVQLDTGVPVVFGVLTTDTVEQALVRSEDDETNKGREAALTAIEMVRALAAIPGGVG
ncbi:MAG: 6,7-dimethyl-8-ribityllumazine synthase [Acidimicrobiales bacterium]|jgi:6,7-dimethyl-8-ribityllumazine synthase